MSGMDGITEIVLENVKLASEKAETIISFLQTMKRLYGEPLATVHDMGRGISHAVQQVFPDARDLICQSSYTLVLWALEGKKQAQGYGFPFDRPYLAFYHRLQTLHSALKQLKELHPWEERQKRPDAT